jgi:hypothetical protein
MPIPNRRGDEIDFGRENHCCHVGKKWDNHIEPTPKATPPSLSPQ